MISSTIGYTGGHTRNPTYEEFCEGNTGHVKTFEVVLSPARFPWHEVTKVQHYYLNVDAIMKPVRVNEPVRTKGNSKP